MRNPTKPHSKQLLSILAILLVVPSGLSSCANRKALTGRDKKNVDVQILKPVDDNGEGKKEAAKQAPIAGINTATIWFIKSEGDKLTYVSENREHEGNFAGPVDGLTFAINELLSGPKGPLQSQGASSEIPPGTVLIGVSEGKATPDITIDMSQRFSQGAGPDSFDSRIEQLKRTAEVMAPGRNIFLNVEGKRLTATGEGLEVPQPICGPAAATAAAASAQGEGAGSEGRAAASASSSSSSISGGGGDSRSSTLQLAH